MFERFLKPHLLRLANQFPVITLTGPRQAGKTTLCQTTFHDYQYANLEDLEIRQFACQDPRQFLAQYKQGVILDEIQRTPDLPSYIQGLVDQSQQCGQYILTGSQQFEVTQTINQSLAGRTAILRLLPLAYGELYPPSQKTKLSEILYEGFYPRIQAKHLNPTEANAFYLSTYVERDIRSLIHLKDLSSFERFLKICVSQIGQLVNYSQLANDCGITQNTVKSWLSILEASYIIFRLTPHYQNFKKRLTKSHKLYFIDVSLAVYLLGITSHKQLELHPLKGMLFENFITIEFLKYRYNQVRDSNLYFFRDHLGNEIDLILDYGQFLISVEIKSAATISGHFNKNLHFYHRLSGERNIARFIVYAGDIQSEWQGIHIYPYWQLEKLFSHIDHLVA